MRRVAALGVLLVTLAGCGSAGTDPQLQGVAADPLPGPVLAGDVVADEPGEAAVRSHEDADLDASEEDDRGPSADGERAPDLDVIAADSVDPGADSDAGVDAASPAAPDVEPDVELDVGPGGTVDGGAEDVNEPPAVCPPGTVGSPPTCVDPTLVSCLPCASDSDCWAGAPGPDNLDAHVPRCVVSPSDGAGWCAVNCSGGGCPGGLTCTSAAAGTPGLCLPGPEGCATCPLSGAGAVTSCFATYPGSVSCDGTRTCLADGVMGACDAPVPSVELCNGLDDDCDGLVDQPACFPTTPCLEGQDCEWSGCSAEAAVALAPACHAVVCGEDPKSCLCVQITGGGCETGDVCTTAGSCAAGTCVGVPVVCDDDEVCTEDSCASEAGGCVTTPAPGACDDGNACTQDDTCADGACASGAQTDCDDGNPCTDDLCDPADGVCGHQPAMADCDDGDPCTIEDVCSESACSGGPAACPTDPAWWSCDIPYRRPLVIGSEPAGQSLAVALVIDHAGMVAAGLSDTDGGDLRIVHVTADGGTTELDRVLDPESAWQLSNTTLWFRLQAGGGSYLLYHGEESPPPPHADESGVFHFADFFERADSQELGEGWEETEGGGQVSIADGAMHFDVTADLDNRPLADHSFDAIDGTLEWRFGMDWAVTGPESFYRLHMQLGATAAMMPVPAPSDLFASAGAGVSLVWAAPSQGMTHHEALGWAVGSAVSEAAVVSGPHSIAVRAEPGPGTFDLFVDGAIVGASLPFSDLVTSIDRVRILTWDVNDQNFAEGRDFDWMLVRRVLSPEPAAGLGPHQSITDCPAGCCQKVEATLPD